MRICPLILALLTTAAYAGTYNVTVLALPAGLIASGINNSGQTAGTPDAMHLALEPEFDDVRIAGDTITPPYWLFAVVTFVTRIRETASGIADPERSTRRIRLFFMAPRKPSAPTPDYWGFTLMYAPTNCSVRVSMSVRTNRGASEPEAKASMLVDQVDAM